jgi:Flp pilus assembly protein protease CpaA
MSPPMIAFVVGVFVGVLGGIFIIGILQMAREENRISSKESS